MIEELLNQHRAERNAFGDMLMNALHDAMPWGLKVDLGNGQTAELVRLSEPYRQPIYPEGTSNAVDPDNPVEPIGCGEWKFSFDWRLKNCDQDHIELTTHVTGGGGAL